MSAMVAALFVEAGGVYFWRSDVDPWDIARDARKYAGTLPVVAHPPCERWGRYWPGGPSARVRRLLGDDGQCFAAALWAVRTFGGVLEHPEASHAFEFYGLAKPPKRGGWVSADDGRGHVCCVEQGHYGHRARKATWLYAVGCYLPELMWGKAEGKLRLEQGHHSAEERRARPTNHGRITSKENAATPPPIRRAVDQHRQVGAGDRMTAKRRFRRDSEGDLHRVIRFRGHDGFTVRWTEHCTGCCEYPENTTAPERGSGCRECGYTGKRRRVEWVPFDIAAYMKARETEAA